MSKVEKWVALVISVPLLAIFGGVGILAFQIGETWEAGDTRALISGFTTACAGGFVVLALVLGLVVGVPLALRAYSAGAWSQRRWDDWSQQVSPPARPALPAPRPTWMETPPQVAAREAEGEWRTLGPAAYDLFDEGDAGREGMGNRDFVDGDWRS
jgi:hypothetical protein